jgi:hypothetical protein
MDALLPLLKHRERTDWITKFQTWKKDHPLSFELSPGNLGLSTVQFIIGDSAR